MGLKNSLTTLLYLLVCNLLLAQEIPPSDSQQSQDSLAEARKKRYEETLKYLAEMKRRREKNPERYADSVASVKEEKRYEAAKGRIEAFQNSADLKDIKELDLTGGRLNEIPEWVYRAQNLEILILDHNQIFELPKKLSELKSLRRIYWRSNELGNNRIRIAKLEGIEKLDLTGNELEKLPKVHRMDGLEELVLEDNAFTKIPTWRGRRLKELKELDISSNPLEMNRRWYWLLDHIAILKLNKCEINAIHHSFYKMDGLKELQIQINRLTEIPEGISRLESLSKLSFYKNDLKYLPADFFELEKLRVIDLYYNSFEKIPAEIGQLDSLEILYLSFNKLYDIPSSIGELSGLEELYIHHNRLSEIPGNLGDLDQLKTFHFQDNYIPDFPMQILGMESLIDLDISNTDIRSLPPEISNLELRNFYWRDLDIDLNDPDNLETRDALIQMKDQGTNVVPGVSVQIVPTND